MRPLKGIIFDFNGVLFWDGHLQEKAWKACSKKLRGTELSDDEVLHMVHGRVAKEVLEYILGTSLSAEEVKKYADEKEAAYRAMCLENKVEFKLSPGASEFLDYLKEHDVPSTIATASPLDNLHFFFENLNLANWFAFDKVVYDDGSIKGKPAPDIYLKAAKVLGLDPADCMVIEDAHSGIAAAHRAGIGQIVAMGSEAHQETLQNLAGVTQTATDFNELLIALKSFNTVR